MLMLICNHTIANILRFLCCVTYFFSGRLEALLRICINAFPTLLFYFSFISLKRDKDWIEYACQVLK